MKSKSTKAPKKLSDRAAEEESVRNHLCLLEFQLAELKRTGELRHRRLLSDKNNANM
ncbi:uncharacterized protein DS421_16g542780 [Arachis hypogaea]|nr:uncharacterized protein DS421_16g542780 [Arachis hypogaea]